MSGDNLRVKSFPWVFVWLQISALHGPSSANPVVFEETEGIGAHFKLVGYSNRVYDSVRARS